MTKRRKNRRLLLSVYRLPAGKSPRLRAGELLVEYFSDSQILGWRARGEDIQKYHYLWYFELESQRAANHEKLSEALSVVPGRSVEIGGWGRAMAYKYSNSPLSCVGSLKWVGGRFNYGVDIDSTRFAPFPALYLAEDAETGLREMHGLLREDRRAGLTAKELNLCGASGVTWATVEGAVHNVFDLTHAENLKHFSKVLSSFTISRNVRAAEEKLGARPLRLITTPTQLHQSFMQEHWREFPAMMNTPANSQLFGHLLTQAGFEGVLYSSTITGKQNLALFPRQFSNSASRVRVATPPINATCCELTATTYTDLEIP